MGRFYFKAAMKKKFTQEYTDYLQSPEWNKKRIARLKKDKNTCQSCGATDKPLDIDHITYERFGNEKSSDLQALCRDCHDFKHGNGSNIIFDVCRTCGQFLMIFVEKIKVLGTWWTQYTCQDGHIRSYKDDD